jgi:hypothetical protein
MNTEESVQGMFFAKSERGLSSEIMKAIDRRIRKSFISYF